jgi:PAS domain S-box-containing protein
MRGNIPPAGTSLAPHLQLTSLLDTLPDAVIFLNEKATIQYANASAARMLEASTHELPGKDLRQCAPHIVTDSFYQAVMTVTHTRKPLEVKYRCPVTRSWLRVYLSPTNDGVAVFFHEDTEPTRLQDAFHQSEQQYQDLLEGLSGGVAILTPEGLVLDINQRPLVDAQIRREAVVGKPFTDFPLWSSMPAAQEQLRAAIAQASRGETACFEARIHPQAGTYVDLAMMIIPHRDASKRVEYLICAARNITERKHEEEELRALVVVIPHFVWILRPDGSAQYSNRRWCDYTGMTSEPIQRDGWLQFIHPDDRQRIQDAWQTAVRTGTPYEVELRIQNGRTGDYRWFLARNIPYKDVQGAILYWIATCTDIDEQKQAAERIKASEQNWRVLAETVPQVVWTTRPDGRLDYANQRYCDVTQTDVEHLRDYGWRQFVHPEDLERALALQQHSIEAGELYENEYRLKDGRTGAYRWFLARALPMRDEAGQITKWFGTCTDIEDQKRIEEALRQSQEKMRTLMDSSIIGIAITEGEEVVEANDAYLRMTGYSREDLSHRRMNWVRMTPPEYMARTQQAHQELAIHHYMTPYEKEYICKDGSRLPILAGGVILPFDPAQNIYFVLDNSARKELEQRKDDFISMAGHELRTPLTSVKTQVQLVRRRLVKQGLHEAAAALLQVEEPVKQLERLVGELLDVSKIQAGRLKYVQEPVDLEALLGEVAQTMQQMSTTHAVVVRGAAPRTLIGDKGRLEQVFINLINNAMKYSPGATSVEIDLSASTETVTVSVRDHGIGIPQEQYEKIFERFYRVPDLRQGAISGLGMGLYIVAEIIRHHGGTVRIESDIGHGSTFHVTLPLKSPITPRGDPAQG